MKDILVLLVLLTVQTIKVCSQPYQADSDGKCRNETTEYLLEGTTLCCKRCRPGEKMTQICSETNETKCEPCPARQYKESWNFSPTCFSCKPCKATKGLQDVQKCSPTTKAKCGCMPGMYCIMGFVNPYCEACRKYSLCRAGFGVSVQGRADSDVRCERCPDGTFSNTVSNTDRCQPHTICHGSVVRKGNATSDTVCGPGSEPEVPIPNTGPKTSTGKPHSATVLTTASTTMTTVSAASGSTLSISPSVPEKVFNNSANSPPPSTVSDSTLTAVIVTGVILLFIFIFILLHRCKKMRRKDPARLHPKVDANGNCEIGDKINPGYLEETQLISFTVTSPEQQCLLEKGEACSDQSQSSNTTETLTRTDGCSSCESIGPLQSTLPLHNPHSALSEPKTLLSNIEPGTPQTSVPPQCSSQPTSPQIINPVTNININFHIGNGTGRTLSVTPTDLLQVDSKLHFGEEEATFSIPQQEDGKQSLMSVQESESCSALRDTCTKD